MKHPILHTLTHRLASMPLSACPGGMRAARRLERDGWISTVSMMVSTAIVPPVSPLEDIPAGEMQSVFAVTANILQTRWDGPRRAEAFMLATKKAVLRHGGYGVGKLRAADADHDYFLALVFQSLSDRERSRWRGAAWLEAQGISFGGWLPDAVILGRPMMTLIEVGGASYTKDKLERRANAARGFRRILY
jgi:hypothetical protein